MVITLLALALPLLCPHTFIISHHAVRVCCSSSSLALCLFGSLNPSVCSSVCWADRWGRSLRRSPVHCCCNLRISACSPFRVLAWSCCRKSRFFWALCSWFSRLTFADAIAVEDTSLAASTEKKKKKKLDMDMLEILSGHNHFGVWSISSSTLLQDFYYLKTASNSSGSEGWRINNMRIKCCYNETGS